MMWVVIKTEVDGREMFAEAYGPFTNRDKAIAFTLKELVENWMPHAGDVTPADSLNRDDAYHDEGMSLYVTELLGEEFRP